jgi:hypothetical protein
MTKQTWFSRPTKVLRSRLGNQQDEDDGGGPCRVFFYSQADQESAGIKQPSQCRLDLLEEALSNSFLLGCELVSWYGLAYCYRPADGVNGQQGGCCATLAPFAIVKHH